MLQDLCILHDRYRLPDIRYGLHQGGDPGVGVDMYELEHGHNGLDERVRDVFTQQESLHHLVYLTPEIYQYSRMLNSQAARHLYPAWTVKVFFSLDFIYLVSLDRISGGYQEDILEQFEKSKMAAKMAAIVKKKLNHLILFIKSRVISLFPLNVIRGIHFWC